MQCYGAVSRPMGQSYDTFRKEMPWQYNAVAMVCSEPHLSKIWFIKQMITLCQKTSATVWYSSLVLVTPTSATAERLGRPKLDFGDVCPVQSTDPGSAARGSALAIS